MLPQQLADNRPPAMDGDKPRQTPAGLRQGLPSWRHRWSGSQATSGQSEAAAGQRNTPAQRQPLGEGPSLLEHKSLNVIDLNVWYALQV